MDLMSLIQHWIITISFVAFVLTGWCLQSVSLLAWYRKLASKRNSDSVALPPHHSGQRWIGLSKLHLPWFFVVNWFLERKVDPLSFGKAIDPLKRSFLPSLYLRESFRDSLGCPKFQQRLRKLDRWLHRSSMNDDSTTPSEIINNSECEYGYIVPDLPLSLGGCACVVDNCDNGRTIIAIEPAKLLWTIRNVGVGSRDILKSRRSRFSDICCGLMRRTEFVLFEQTKRHEICHLFQHLRSGIMFSAWHPNKLTTIDYTVIEMQAHWYGSRFYAISVLIGLFSLFVFL